MLAQFEQRNERQQVPDEAATLLPCDVETRSREDGNIERTLDLSASRAYDSALEILEAYKLTGNFHTNLEIVLKEIDAFDKVTFEVKPMSQLPYFTDRRRVLFRPNDNIHMSQFSAIMRSLRRRIGFDATSPWWVRIFQ